MPRIIARGRAVGRPQLSAVLPPLYLLAACLACSGCTALLGGGQAAWLGLPVALAAAGFVASLARAAAAAGLVVAAALAPAAIFAHTAAPGSLITGVGIAAVSIGVMLAVRRRGELERRRLRASAFSDPLTGVANRRALLDRIEYEVARHSRLQREFAVLALDLDGFKALNDRFGHPAGDELLCDVAGALRRAVREQDTVARTGGDEFCVLAPETGAAGVQRLAVRAETAVARVTAGLDTLSASVGGARFPHDGRSAAAVLAAADADLLSHKRRRQARGERPQRAA